jgi:regulator of sirC expression with transglutaminase-like and TPR domain
MFVKCLLFSLFCFSTVAYANQDQAKNTQLEAKVEAANLLAKSGDYVHAEAELNAVIAKDPKNARAYKLRGHVYYAKKEYKKALMDLDRVVQLIPDHPNALVDRAIVHSMLGQHGLALADVEHALQLKPDSHFAQSVRQKVLELAQE